MGLGSLLEVSRDRFGGRGRTLWRESAGANIAYVGVYGLGIAFLYGLLSGVQAFLQCIPVKKLLSGWGSIFHYCWGNKKMFFGFVVFVVFSFVFLFCCFFLLFYCSYGNLLLG